MYKVLPIATAEGKNKILHSSNIFYLCMLGNIFVFYTFNFIGIKKKILI